MCKKKRWLVAVFLSALVTMTAGWNKEAQCQPKFPSRGIDILMPFAPGGGTDTSARLTAGYLSKKWGVPINVINKPGGNTLPANVELYSAAPDGYTVFGDSPPSSSMLETVVKDSPVKAMDRTFIAMTMSTPMVFVVPAASPFKNLRDIEAEIKKDPANFAWGSLGGAGGPDFVTRSLFKAIGVDVMKTKPVMFKGGGQMIPAVSGGHIKLGSTNPSTAIGPVAAGVLRVIAVAARERNSEFPDVPTTTEQGYPTVNHISWQAITGTPKIPSYIVEIWDKGIREMSKDDEFIKQAHKAGFKIDYRNSADLRELVRKEAEETASLWEIKK